MKKFLFASLALIIVLLTYVVLHQPKSAHQTVQLDTVKQGDIAETVTAVGTITPKTLITVNSPIAGRVSHLFHDEGDGVRAGEKLLSVKPEPTPANFATATQIYQQAKVSEKIAKQKFESLNHLVMQGTIARRSNEYLNAKKDYDNAQLERELKHEQLALLQRGRAHIAGREIANVVTSPINGIILQRNVNLGDPIIGQSDAQAGNTLFVIANMKNLIFRGQVSEMDVARIKKDMPAVITIAALPNKKITGVISKTALQSIQAAKLSNPDNKVSTEQNNPFNVGFDLEIDQLKIPDNTQLLAGYSATAAITLKQVHQVLIIPERDLHFEKNKHFVWLHQTDGKLKKQFIKIGLSNGMQVEVTSGLKLGDKINQTNA